jgi:NADH-quinone oxidoreductase subunit N
MSIEGNNDSVIPESESLESYGKYVSLNTGSGKLLSYDLYKFLMSIEGNNDSVIPESESLESYGKYVSLNTGSGKLLSYDLYKFIMSIEGNNDNVTNFLGYREIQSTISNEFVLFGLMIIFISIMFKLAIAPLHAWSPDVYEGSPTSSTLFFAVVSKLSLLVLLLRIFYHSFHGLVYSWKFYIVLIAVFSVMVGSFTALEQKKLKSLFAYSSTSHLGYILIAFCSGTLEGVQSIIAYIIIYMLSSSCIWSIIILLKPRDSYNNTKANKDLADVASLIKSNSILGFILSTTLFSIAGFPPLIGFFTKLNIFLSAMESYMFLVAIVSILASIISTFYYIRIIKIICFENKLVGRLYYPLPYLETLIVVINFLLIIFLFINPTILYLISHKISLYLF